MDLLPDLKRQMEMEALERLQEELIDTLRRHDPLHVADRMRDVEYVPEVETMLPRIREAPDPRAIEEVLREELQSWRGADAASQVDLAPIAAEMAGSVRRFREQMRG